MLQSDFTNSVIDPSFQETQNGFTRKHTTRRPSHHFLPVQRKSGESPSGSLAQVLKSDDQKRTALLNRNTLICKQIWFCRRLTWNPAKSLVYDVSRRLNVLYQAASCFSCYDN
ncbi:hypothetical protein T265_08563 [Opisthorchis viverrini]|uniref:Uncharacterized protein n=1 Tax=Opisthorchis viverrini TaxID=6198 RepID=A0A074ZJN0_OPIVI|nr:hypothetical protein T265_08563 [Opisthorchis viverrini]KER23570.1 hypothetical protein T265_08563 [Opisthorchis viverrini]